MCKNTVFYISHQIKGYQLVIKKAVAILSNRLFYNFGLLPILFSDAGS